MLNLLCLGFDCLLFVCRNDGVDTADTTITKDTQEKKRKFTFPSLFKFKQLLSPKHTNISSASQPTVVEGVTSDSNTTNENITSISIDDGDAIGDKVKNGDLQLVRLCYYGCLCWCLTLCLFNRLWTY